MHERRNFILVLLLAGSLIWAVVAWVFLDMGTVALVQRVASILLAVAAAAWLVYGLLIEDKLPDYLTEIVGTIYYEADGLSFMPMIRSKGGHAELCVYYQNRFEGPVQAIVHMRPVQDFEIKPGWRDVHFAFKADGGDFGAIHQPMTVPQGLRGEVIDFHLASATYYPRGQGSKLRTNAGIPCGSLHVDWGGAAFKTGVHEVSGEIELIRPAQIHLSMPESEAATCPAADTWRQERLHAGNVA